MILIKILLKLIKSELISYLIISIPFIKFLNCIICKMNSFILDTFRI